MDTQRTPGEWSQGFVLLTEQTRRWRPEDLACQEEQERRRVFANFKSADQGRSRVPVAICERPEDAAFIARAPDLLATLQSVLALVEDYRSMTDPEMHAALRSIKHDVGLALAKITS